MGRNFQKFLLLSWKNWLLQWRHPIQTLIEILAPVLFAALLVLIRSLVDPEEEQSVTYDEFSPVINPTINIPDNFLQNFTFNSIEPVKLYWSPCGNRELKTIMSIIGFKFLPLLSQACVNNSIELQRTLELHRDNMFAGIQFDDALADADLISDDMEVVLRFPGELRTNGSATAVVNNWFTHLTFPIYQMPGPRNDDNNYGAIPNYYFEGFLTLQHEISVEIINAHVRRKTNVEADFPPILMQRYPYPAWISDFLLEALKSFVGIIIMLSFVYTCINTVRVITNEKETQMKEAMKIMGLPNWLHWMAWFLKIFVFLLISIILMVVLLKVSWYPDTHFSVFTYSDGTVLFVFMLFYILSTITFCFLISVFFTKANTAATIAGLAWFLSYCPYLFLQEHYNTLSLSAKLAAMLGANTAMAYGFQLFVMFEGTGDGLQWDTFFSSVNPDDSLTLGHVVMMLIIDTIIYLLIALYVESVFPGEFGVAQPWYYPFTASYWCGQRYVGVEDVGSDRIAETDIYESEPVNLKAGIKIKHLRKMYSNKKVAVRDLSLNMFENQITVLLGHNGAGKTTTMSMLTGMIAPTGGTAVINGYDIRTEMNGIRDSLGLCPQHNILFDELTVREHFYFFSKLKGMTNKQEIEAEIKKYTDLLELTPKADAMSKTLSGGMKRKLCVGIALCGKSKVCMFDEPTAGMDPAARRALWDLMQQQKKDRTILLSTHFMDEADLLGDRIAIMAGGQLQCCGTSFFLKKKYGAGYSLVMEKKSKCNVSEVTNALRRHIPNIEVQNDIGSELTYLLAKEQSSVFEEMLRDFENQADELGIATFGISLTTMEEVFMKVGADHGQEEENDILENINGNGTVMRNGDNGVKHSSDTRLNVNDEHTVSGLQLKINQTIAMMMKKVLSTFRSWVLLVIQNLIPVAFLIIAILVARVMTNDTEPARLDLSLDPFHNPITPVATEDVNNVYYKRYKRILENDDREVLDWRTENFITNLLKLGETIITTIRMRYIIGAIFYKDRFVAMFNNEPYHSPPLALQHVMNAVLQEQMDSDKYNIRFTNHPLPYNVETQTDRMFQGNTMGFQLAFNIGFSMAFVSSFYVLFYVKERVNKSKHLQFVSGANVGVYWVTAYVWDFLTFVFTSLCLVITLACFQEPGFATFEELGRVFLLLILFGLAMLPQTYLLALRFEVPSTGYTRLTLINIILGVAAFMVVQTLSVPGLNLEHVADALHWVFLLVPHYAVASGVQDMYTKFTINTLCDRLEEISKGFACETTEMCCDNNELYLAWDQNGIGRNITFLFITATVLTVLLLLIEFRAFEKVTYAFRKQVARTPPSDDVDDTDVLEEKRRVRDGEINKKDYSVVLKDVTKYYDDFLAVNQSCLGIKGGECFGLLGVNGAGKTTTFKMMTGDIPLSSGDAWIYGLNAKTEMKSVHKHIGYCPQFDALLDDLTGKETLIMYCLLRGITLEESKYIAVNLAREFDFYRHIDKQVREYSGGNKRKLSAAVASIGDPPIVFLDEPTTGMDPATKRNLWNTLCRIRESGKCLVLTSHSMEECEALCTRLAIMVNGTFKCLGTTQHLKNKFSQGYTLTVKVQRSNASADLETADTEPIERFVKSNFPSAILRESHQELMTFYIPDTECLRWSKMFGIMEQGKQSLNISDYSLGQSSLEQVFLHFTKFQREE
nr:ATP-binding cassette sub-family A member 3-like [Onthophagus taurus]XP_022911294.1 ATP-binding cassette sub-family A member 3-like [Onthophagus taurus]